MANAFYPLTPDRVVEDFGGVVVRHAPSGFEYRALETDGRYYQEEIRKAPDGTLSHRLLRPMDYVVGSGTAARTYLYEENGRYYELPLTWYARDEGGQWDLSPGYREWNGRFDRTVPASCMSCHNGQSQPTALLDDRFDEVARGIGCERCHGPGAAHVEARLENPDPGPGPDPTIVNSAHLSLDLQLDVCQQCHLSGTVSVLREGAEAFGYRPGTPLSAHRAIYSTVDDDPETIDVISHVDRMKASACFQQSPAMTCTTCHDPHEGFRAKGPAYFNDTCQRCHTTEPLQAAMPTDDLRLTHAAGSNCFSCHMPKVEAEDAPHASFTDHLIRIVDRPLGAAPIEEGRDTLIPYFDRDKGEDAQAQTYRGMAYVVYGRQNAAQDDIRRGAALLQQALAERPAHGEAQFLLGFARLQLGEIQAAVAPLERSVEIGGEIPERLNALAQAYEAQGNDPALIEATYRRALEAQPAASDVWVNYGRFLETQGQVERAVQAYETAAREEPALVASHYNLGTAHLRLGRVEQGREALQEAVRLNPDHADALTNLGVLSAQRGNTEDAGRLFARAVAAEPDNGNAGANYGTFLLEQGKAEQAIGVLRRTVAARPDHADANATLAAALLRTDRFDEASRYAREALRLRPDHPLAGRVLTAAGSG
jgi:tetratricopeptide (TPR) repeat protein